MTTTTVSTDAQLTQAVEETVKAVKVATMQALENATDRTAKEIVAKTREKSPKRTGVYAKNWASRKMAKTVGAYGREVYQKKKPSLTHLLEHGHEIRGAAFFSKNKSRTDAFPHIMKDEEAEKLFEANLTEEVEKEMDKA